MKVLFIASDNNPTSGAFLSMVTLNRLLREIYQVETKVVLPKEGDGKRLLEKNGIPYIICRSYDWAVPVDKAKTLHTFLRHLRNRVYNIRSQVRIAMMIRKEHFDLVHLNTTYANVGEAAARWAGVPYVWHLREMLEEDQETTIDFKRSGYRTIAKADRVIAISNCVYEKYSKLLPDARIKMIYNGIDVERFYHPDKKIMQDPNNMTLIYGGGYTKKKGVFDLAKAIRILKDRSIRGFKLLLIGDITPEFQEYINQLDIGDIIEPLGYQEYVEKCYCQADIAFSCSEMEAFGRKTVEAMLCGCLMISSDTGGSLDIIQDHETGLFYRQGSSESLAETILYAMEHRQESQEIASRGREYAREHFSAEENAKRIYETYQEVLRG